MVGLVIAGAIGFLLWQGLGNATVYFKTADEAVRDKESLGTRRFRVEGVVVDGTVAETGDAVRFTIEENGATVPVRHQGDPPELFRPGIPVVLEGHWQGAAFASDRIMVKHTSENREENPERVEDYTSTTP
jgi:cytochrome c-type biogenesis protein CcmE